MLVRFVVCSLVSLVFAPFLIESAAAAEKKTNVVVFLVDDMGVMDTSVPFLTDTNGEPKRYPLNDYYRTPGMERLAGQGIRFNNFYAMSVCSPTRNSIMTGQNAARHAATNWINPEKDNRGPNGPPEWNWRGLRKTDVTLPRILAGAGYRTIHVGKAHFGPFEAPGGEPLNLGFDINVAGCAIGAPGSYYGKQDYGNKNKKAKNRAVPGLEKYHGSETFLSEALTIEAKKHVSDAVAEGKPFFLYMAHYAVHAPFNSDPRFAANYKDSGKSSKAQAFATLIEGMDKSLNDTLDYLNELNVAEDTLVLFLGDNGSDAPLGHEHAVACAAPLRGKKGSHYEGGMRVPFIAAWAKPNPDSQRQKSLPIPAGAIQPQMGNVTDLLPTILSATGVSAPADHTVDGLPLQRLIKGDSDPSHPSDFLMHYPHAPHRSTYFTSYRSGNWKVVYHFYPSDDSERLRYQLFNLADDPFEQKNLADSQPKELRTMMAALIEQLERHEAKYPVTKDQSKPLLPQMPELAAAK